MTHPDPDDFRIVSALRDAGIVIDDVNGLGQKTFEIRRAAPVLFALLDRLSSDHSRDTIIRSFARKEAQGIAAKRMVHEFRVMRSELGKSSAKMSFAWSVGNTLEQVADDSVADDMIEFAQDKQYGRARQMVALGMARLKDPRVPDVLISLLDDQDIQGHVVMALGKLRSQKAREHIEPFLHHPQTWIRNAAKTALRQIDKGREAK